MSSSPELQSDYDGSQTTLAPGKAAPADFPPADAPPPARDLSAQPLPCPLCEYDLRGQVEERCPECGYRFTWADLTDPARRLHPYLFEHHPERRAWSFVRTHLGALRPKRFWTSLLPAQPSYPRWLILYWCIAASVMVALIAAHYAIWVRASAVMLEVERARWVRLMASNNAFVTEIEKRFGSVQSYLDQAYPRPVARRFFRVAWWNEGGWTLFLAATLLGWPWATFLTLLVFRVSMRRARIRPVHVLRCIVYSFDTYPWVALGVGWLVVYRAVQTWGATPPPRGLTSTFVPGAPIPRTMPYYYRADMIPDALFWLGTVLLLLAAYRLTSAFRHYLKFDHPAATVLASQVIVVLAAIVAAVRLYVP